VEPIELQRQKAIALARARRRRAEPQQPALASNEPAKADMASYSPEFIAEDVAKSGATGITKGTIGLAGMFGDAKKLGGDLTAWGAGKLGMSPENVERARSVGSFLSNPFTPFAPTSEELTQPVQEQFHKPQTKWGEYAETIGELAPGAAAGPGGLVRKTAMTFIPGLVSETAGQLTKGTPYEPYARGAGAVAGGFASAGKQGAATKAMAKAAPSAEAVKGKTNQMYDTLRAAGIKYDADEFDRFATGLVSRLQKDLRKAQAPKAHDALNQIIESVGTSPDFADIESMRRTAGALVRSPDETERHFGGLIVDALDDFDLRAPLISDGSIPAGQVAAYKKQAREMASRNIKNRKLERMIGEAEGYQGGLESGLRNQFGALLKRIMAGKERGWTKEEIAAIRRVAKGNFSNNVLGIAGRFGLDLGNLGNRAALLPGALAAGGYAADGLVTGGAGVAAATGAKYAARKMTQGAAKRAQGVVRAGKANQLKARKLESKEGLKIWLRRLLAAQAGV
jgi:hypothetical protein